MQIGKAGPAVSGIAQAYPDRVEVRGRDLCGDLMGRLSFTEYFHLLLTGRGADRGSALLPRPAPGRDRGARHDADQRRGEDDACGRPGVAAGRGCGRHPRLRPGHPGHLRGVRRAARGGAGEGARRRRRGGVTLEMARAIHGRAAARPGSAIPSTVPSIRAPSGSWSCLTSAA